MANQSKTISQPLYTMTFDLHPIDLKDGMYAFGKNAVIENFDGNGILLGNEQSNMLAANFPSGSTVVGFVNIIEQDRIIWFLSYPNSGLSEIGESLNSEGCRKYVQDSQGSCDDCSLNLLETSPLETIKQKPCASYRTIQQDACLNFSVKFPIRSVQYVLTDCTLQIFFTDGVNPRRYLEFNYIDDDPTQGLVIKNTFYQIIGFENPPCDIPIYGSHLDCNALSVQPNTPTPCIVFEELVSGGSNLAGDYQFFIVMSDIKGNNLTSFLSATNPIPIFTKEITLVTNYPTDKAIKLSIQNLDPTGAFQYYNLAVAKTIDGVTSFYLVGTFPVTQTTYIYTGNNKSEIVLDESIIFTLYPYYKTAGVVGQSNGILFYADVTEFSKPNWQRVANEINLQWQTIAIPEEAYKDPKNTVDFRGYMRDEVYALGIQFIYDSGDESNAYHIPGRPSVPSDLVPVENNDVIPSSNCSGDTLVQRWQVYNTGTVLGGNLSIYDGCTESCYQYGDFSYWQSTQTYPVIPEIWGELCGEPIRHHKFPDSTVTHIHNRQNGSVDTSGNTYVQNNIVFPIGIRVDHDSVRAAIASAVSGGIITADDAARVVGYRIVRGNRFGNKSIVAKGLLYDVNQYIRVSGSSAVDQQPVYFANYPYNDLRSNPFITNQFNNYTDPTNNMPHGPDLPFTFSNRYTFHSPDTHFNEPSVGTELKLETVEYGTSQGYYNIAQKQAKQKLLSDFSYYLALSAGIVAALLTTNEKVVIPYTVKSDYKFSQESNGTIGTATFNSGQDIEGTGTTTITTTNAGGSIGSHSLDEGTRREAHDNPFGDADPDAIANQVFNSGGVAGPHLADINGDDVEPAEYTITTTKGTYSQYYNNPFLNGNVMSGVLTSILLVAGSVESFITIVLQEMDVILGLINAFTPYRDWCVQFNSVGKYNNYVPVANDAGNKRRLLIASSYLAGNENQSISEEVDPITGQFDFIDWNGFGRESALYLKYFGTAFSDAGTYSGHPDQSRIPLGNAPYGCSLNIKQYTPISSYYASIKNTILDQYGSVFNIQYLRTGSCAFDMSAQNSGCTGVYGGDTFINRFALKIKVPYFLADTFNLPAGTDFDFTQVTNLAVPRNFYNNTNGLVAHINSIFDLLNPINLPYNLGRPNSIRSCDSGNYFYQTGWIYLYHYGIPYFFAESDYNVDYRYGTNVNEGDFYPNQADLNYWLQQQNVPIIEDNTYFYNNTYSKQNEETSINIDPLDFMPDRECLVDHSNRIIYSESNAYLIFPANNFVDLPLTDGRIISLDSIENQTMLVRTENQTLIFKTILRIPVDGQVTQVGNGSIFANPPQDFGTTDLGYIGTQNRGILRTEYGHIWADAKRGQVFNFGTGGGGVDEISKQGMKNWFKENLPFRLLRDFPNMPTQDIDNNFIGSGLIYAFDKRNNRFLMTKRDWKRTNPNVLYNSTTKEFYIQSGMTQVPITLGDLKYFKDCSWTISYNFFTKTWVSLHSYLPNFYIDFVDYFTSGINGNNSSWWVHDLYNGSFQVYYGQLYPFIVEPVIKFGAELKMLSSIEFDTEVRRYANEFDYTLKKHLAGFNKAVIYNDFYNSGLLDLLHTDKNDFSLVGKYPQKNFNSWTVEVATANYKWRVNQFAALNKDFSEVPFWIYAGNNADKSLNDKAFNYSKNDYNLSPMKGQWFKTRLINDIESNHKILFKLQINNETVTYR